ncbi:IS5 family transposase [Streptomyces sp. NPDC056944]|uniref:IS5 family transposase n=1 Tax=Streptomyces sp. NPDC056944 TaxID=3345972 RepID=UPI0036253C0C
MSSACRPRARAVGARPVPGLGSGVLSTQSRAGVSPDGKAAAREVPPRAPTSWGPVDRSSRSPTSGPDRGRRRQRTSLRQRGERSGNPVDADRLRRPAGPPGGQRCHRALDLDPRSIERVHQVAVEGEQTVDAVAGAAQLLAPTDRGKLGSKIHLITDRNGPPLSLGTSAANMHDSLGLEPLVRGIPPIHSRRGPRRRHLAKLHTDKGYDYDHLRRCLRSRGIRHGIAHKGIESSQRLGRHRWVVERTVSWLAGCRRLHRRYERKAEHFLAFVGIAALRICFRRLTT